MHMRQRSEIALQQKYDAEDIYGGMSLLVSTGGVTLLPLYVQDMLIPTVVSRPLQGEPPTIDSGDGLQQVEHISFAQ